MNIYRFKKEQWDQLVGISERYKTYMPVFIEDMIISYFTSHKEDRAIIDENELLLIIEYIKLIIDYDVKNKKSIKKSKNSINDNKKKEMVEYDFLNELLGILFRLQIEHSRAYDRNEDKYEHY